VLVWQSQLAANDFPPVCAMTGATAETWRKFNFSSAPPYAFWFGGLIVAALMSRRASGYLPLTHASAKMLRLSFWSLVALIPIGAVVALAGLTLAGASNGESVGTTIGVLGFVLGLATLIVGLIGLAIVRRTLGPTGKIFEPQPGQYQSLIELRNVHPAFVAAVQQLQQMRAQQAYPSQSPNP
jgi:hypothetical protein